MHQGSPGDTKAATVGGGAGPLPPATQRHITLSVIATEAVRIHLPGLRARQRSSLGADIWGDPRPARPHSAPAPATEDTSHTGSAAWSRASTPTSKLIAPRSGQQEQQATAGAVQQQQRQLKPCQPAGAFPDEPAVEACQALNEATDAEAFNELSSSFDPSCRPSTLPRAASRQGLLAEPSSRAEEGSRGATEDSAPDAPAALWEQASAGHTPWATTSAEAAADTEEELAAGGGCGTHPSPARCSPQPASAAGRSPGSTQQAWETQDWTAVQAALVEERAARLAVQADLQRLRESAEVSSGKGGRLPCRACMSVELQQG